MLEKTSFPREQARQPHPRAQGLDMGEGFDAGRRIVINQNVVDTETGAREKIQMHGAGDVNRPV